MKIINETLNILSIIFLIASFLLALISCWRFEDVLTKLVSLEVLANIFICGIGMWAVYTKFSMLLDICIALSLIIFLSTVAYCQFLLNVKVKKCLS